MAEEAASLLAELAGAAVPPSALSSSPPPFVAVRASLFGSKARDAAVKASLPKAKWRPLEGDDEAPLSHPYGQHRPRLSSVSDEAAAAEESTAAAAAAPKGSALSRPPSAPTQRPPSALGVGAPAVSRLGDELLRVRSVSVASSGPPSSVRAPSSLAAGTVYASDAARTPMRAGVVAAELAPTPSRPTSARPPSVSPRPPLSGPTDAASHARQLGAAMAAGGRGRPLSASARSGQFR